MSKNPKSHPKLKPKQVHVWIADVTQFIAEYKKYYDLLSTDEKERADKFRFEDARNTYVIGKGVLRVLLGKYLNQAPEEINFKYNEQSKPYVDNSKSLQFNISHSSESILFGFTFNHNIGVDIEFNKREVEIAQIAKRFFSKNESESLLALPKNLWLQSFYNCWTRKEAYIKAKGGGLSLPLDQFEVSFEPDKKAMLKSIYWNQEEVKNWKLDAFTYAEDYTAAILVNTDSCRFHHYDCSYLLIT